MSVFIFQLFFLEYVIQSDANNTNYPHGCEIVIEALRILKENLLKRKKKNTLKEIMGYRLPSEPIRTNDLDFVLLL